MKHILCECRPNHCGGRRFLAQSESFDLPAASRLSERGLP